MLNILKNSIHLRSEDFLATCSQAVLMKENLSLKSGSLLRIEWVNSHTCTLCSNYQVIQIQVEQESIVVYFKIMNENM